MPQKLEHILLLPRHTTPDPHHAGVSPEMTVDPEHTHPANTITKPPKDHLPVHIKHPRSPKTGNTSNSPLMTHPQSTTGGSCLSQIFWEHENLSDLSIIQLIHLL